MENLRRSKRVQAQHFISYDLLDGEGRVVHSGIALSRNLSREGILIEDRRAFPIDSIVKLNVAVIDEVMAIRSKVRHVENAGKNTYTIGLEFVDKDEEMIQTFMNYYPDL
ncbi:MAG: PilZ domain-containing protein [Calditrichia bacterium]